MGPTITSLFSIGECPRSGLEKEGYCDKVLGWLTLKHKKELLGEGRIILERAGAQGLLNGLFLHLLTKAELDLQGLWGELEMETLPRPTLWAVPSPVAPEGTDVTLRCQGHLGSDRFQLWREGELREERNASWQQTEFVLKSVDAWRDGRSYSCRSGQGPLWSELSEPLALVVIGSKYLIGELSARKRKLEKIEFLLEQPGGSAPHHSPGPCPPMDTQSPASYDLASLRCGQSVGFTSCQQCGQGFCWWIVLGMGSLRCGPEELHRCLTCLGSPGLQEGRGLTEGLAQSWTLVSAPLCGAGSCRHYSWTSFPSRSKAFPRPSISASPGSVLSPGTTVTIRCDMSPPTALQDYSFALLEAKSLEPLQIQSPAGTRAVFSIQSVVAEDSGSYSCIYYRKTAPHRASSPSNTMELTVLGHLPRPTLWAQPDLMMASGANITLWCSRPKSSLEEVTFTLVKAGTQGSIQHQTSTDLWIGFYLPSVRPEDTGSYSCNYRARTTPARESQFSYELELVVP
ncbi:immunoglobulin superfamily member 1-like, partial [Petaurus breviceps papuanus]|uniref:immunoglobulin superfamily member 1-like n=1 Tax=Petaurus breviceps papuanus TaxID=3040969 RepID=UPI0036DF14B5